MISKVMKQ
jgi:curved DNA-binding protein CbpA